jgi:hypothetical protein
MRSGSHGARALLRLVDRTEWVHLDRRKGKLETWCKIFPLPLSDLGERVRPIRPRHPAVLSLLLRLAVGEARELVDGLVFRVQGLVFVVCCLGFGV